MLYKPTIICQQQQSCRVLVKSPDGVEPPSAEEITTKVAGGKLSPFDSRVGGAAVKVSRLIM